MSGSSSVLILGAAGGLGSAMARKLVAARFEVMGLDIHPPADEAVPHFLQADVRDPATLRDLGDRQVDIVLLALPAALAEDALENVVKPHCPGALIADLFSEKHAFAERVSKELPHASHMGIHPLFAPSVDWQGQNLIISPRRIEDPRAHELIGWFERWGVAIHRADPDEHDDLMGVVQVGVHATLVAYAQLLVDRRVDFGLLEAVSTPAARVLWAMIARIIENGPEVYWEIQTMNSAAPAVRRELVEAVARLDHLSATGVERPFDGLFEQVESLFGERLSAYVGLARSLVRHGLEPAGPDREVEAASSP